MKLNARTSRPAGRVQQSEVIKERDSDDSELAEHFLNDMLDMQRQQQHQSQQMMQLQHSRDIYLQQLMNQHQQSALSMTLPNIQVPTFGGDPVDYCHFVKSFENLIETKTTSNSARLYYLVQYTSGDVQELMRSCLSMSLEEGYPTAKKLLKQRYGQDYRIATAYLARVTKVPPIKSEDGDALQRFSVLLTSCKNTLKELGYLNRLESPECLQNVISRLPYSLRQRWRDVADDITSNKRREITFEDVEEFVEARARALTHPIFGKINTDSRIKSAQDFKGTKGRFIFGMNGKIEMGDGVESRPYHNKCPRCNGPHMLPRCDTFKKETLENRIKFVRKQGLCDNCLFQGHISRSCPKQSFCKVSGCQATHSTFLHPRSVTQQDENQLSKELSTEAADKEIQRSDDVKAHNAYVNANNSRRDVIGADVTSTG